MSYHRRRSLVYLCALAFGLPTTPAWSQITGYQSGPGTVRPRSSGYQAREQANKALDSFRELHSHLISVRIDARMNLDKLPKEANRCIDACDRLESLINRISGELGDGHVEPQSLSTFKDAWHDFQIARRDLYEAISNPPRPYRLPGWKIGDSGLWH
jgi:hypothetical protein